MKSVKMVQISRESISFFLEGIILYNTGETLLDVGA